MPKLIQCTQGDPVWLKTREGRITASRMRDVLATRKDGKEAAPRYNYKMELLSERLTGRAAEHYVSPEMDWGTEMEPMARAAYELAFEVMTDRIGFAVHPEMDFSGASPDALVGDDGMIEIKAPKTTTHLSWRMAGTVPDEHLAQMMWGMVCCERKWCDFVSYDPRLPEGLQIFCVRMNYDQAIADQMNAEVRKFNDEIEAMIEKLRGGR